MVGHLCTLDRPLFTHYRTVFTACLCSHKMHSYVMAVRDFDKQANFSKLVNLRVVGPASQTLNKAWSEPCSHLIHV